MDRGERAPGLSGSAPGGVVLVDALNVAWWCGDPPSLRLPISLLTALLARGRHAVLVFDASARYRLAAEQDTYAQLIGHPAYALEVPSGRRADDELLRRARAAGGCIVSRDRFSDHRRRHRSLVDDPARVLAGTVADDVVRVPGLALEVSLPTTAPAAWDALRAYLGRDPCASLP